MEALIKTLDRMPYCFSSNQFSEVAKRNGLTKRQIANGVIAGFLKGNAIPGESSRMWYKRKDNAIAKVEPPRQSGELTVQAAIDFLKTNGYRVSKQVVEWVEL